MIKALVVDDESCIREIIQMFLEIYFPQVVVVAQVESVEEAIGAIEKHQPQLVFLDIEIKGGTGFQVLQKLKKRDFKIIFVTAHNEFAIQAIKFSAIDYLMKPINEFEFKVGVDRALQEIEKQEIQSSVDLLLNNYQDRSDKKLVLRTAKELVMVNVSQIVRCQADNVYTTFFLESGEKVVVSKSLADYTPLLEPFGFIRTHQSHLVNLNYIKKLDKSDGGFLLLKNNAEIPISVRRKQIILDFLNNL